jgi:hypothetical protein
MSTLVLTGFDELPSKLKVAGLIRGRQQFQMFKLNYGFLAESENCRRVTLSEKPATAAMTAANDFIYFRLLARTGDRHHAPLSSEPACSTI